MARSTYSQVDEYGFERPDNFNYEAHDSFMSKYIRTLTRRAQRWSTLKGGNKYAKGRTLKRFVRKGIPANHRQAAWMAVSGAMDMKQRNPKTYSELRRSFTNQHMLESIQVDVPRTFPDNMYFKDDKMLPRQLYNVLAAFGHQNADVGYCQGLNYIAGLLLLATKDEEVSFWMLKCLVERILPPYYIVTMSGLLVDLDVLDELVRVAEPAVRDHVHRVGMPWAMGVTKWFVCIYAEVLPTETVLRIWDCLFYEGSKVLFRVAITLIRLHKQEILQAKDLAEMIACFRNMRNHARVIDCHEFMREVFALNVTTASIEKLRTRFKKNE